ncbi:MAG: acyltransferase [Muribaculaceae bacterium]|nr:acyltransferase [Muribaculaceae bacterium]
MAAKERIAYIDFMKGLCIILVVAFHIDTTAFGVPYGYMLQQFRIPMYFFLSGLFFKLYDGFFDFARKKINNIIVPLILFLIIGAIYYFCRNLIGSHFSVAKALELMPLNPIKNNTPTWFLVVLFEVNIIYYLLQKFLPRWLTIVAALLLSVVGYAVVQAGYNLILYFDIALVAMPFFVLGSESKKLGLLEKGPHMAVRVVFAIVVAVILFFFSQRINMLHRVYPSYFRLYLLPALSIMSLLFLCQYIKRPVPIITYLGRYSIMVLGTHYFLILPLRAVIFKLMPSLANASWSFLIVLVFVLAVEFPVIYILKKYLPRFTAQEEFFYKGWKIRK